MQSTVPIQSIPCGTYCWRKRTPNGLQPVARTMSRESTTINTWPIALVRILDAQGVDGRRILAEAGLDPGLIENPNGRVSVAAMARLWKLAVAATDDPCLGLKAAAFVQPATFHSLGLALLASQNLEDALLRAARFSRIVSNAADVSVETSDRGIKQVVTWRAETPPVFESIDLLMASTLKMGMLLLGLDPRAPRPLELRLRRPAVSAAMQDEFQDHFCCPIEFCAEENSLFIAREWTHRRLPMGNPQLARQNDLVVMDYLAHCDEARISERVRIELISRLPTGEPARADIASALHLSEKTLQRRLHDEDTSYQRLLDDVRRELAQQYLLKGPHSVCEITFQLGFSDQSSFTRAFRRWTGVTPGQFRERP